MAEKKERYYYIDYLRLAVIVLVVIVHLACTYSNIGSWYYYEKRILGIAETVLFGLFQSFTQAYFMGFMFLLAGIFVPSTYDQKGFKKFIKDRAVRLGIPALIYMLIINPFIVYGILGRHYGINRALFFKDYMKDIVTLEFLGHSGPLWFAFALCIFCVIYAIIRHFSKKGFLKGGLSENEAAFPNVKIVFGFITIMAIITFLVRTVQPIGTEIMNMQLCFFTQYILLFIVGIITFRNKWLEKLDYKWGIRWLKAALIAGPIMLIGIFIMTGAAESGVEGFSKALGGLRPASFIYSLWESFIAVSMSIGLIAFFKEKLNKPIIWLKTLSDNGFTVYIFHAPIIVGLAYFLRAWQPAVLIKFGVMVIFSLAVCFAAAHFILRKIPLLKKIL